MSGYGEYQPHWHDRNFACRLREFIYCGHRCVSLENELIRVVIAADKGTDILEFLYKPLDLEFLWHSWQGLRAFEHFRPSSPLLTGNFRDYYPGGWHEMLPNGAEPCTHRGAEFGFHGEVTHLPWEYQILEDSPERIAVRFHVRTVRIPLYVRKDITLETGSAALRIKEEIVSAADHSVEILWGHHPTFGWPFLEEGCQVLLPDCRVSVAGKTFADSRLAPGQTGRWPMLKGHHGEIDLSIIPGPQARSQDFVRIEDLKEGRYTLLNPRRGVGFQLWWDVSVFPVLGFWQVFRGGADYPHYGMHYLAALEPACDLPSLASAAHSIQLQPGIPLCTALEATIIRL